MKAAALLSVLLGAASIDAGVTNVERRQEAKDMNQFAEWMAARGTCPVYITKTPPKNDRSMSICVEFCKKTDDGEYSSVRGSCSTCSNRSDRPLTHLFAV